MLYYYARIMFQRMRNRKLPGIINVGGLAFSLAAVILIARWVQNERSFDSYHNDADNIYLVKSLAVTKGQEIAATENTPYPLGQAISTAVPELEETTQMMRMYNDVVLKNGNEVFREKIGIYADARWFEVFKYKFVDGSAAMFNTNPNSIVITESWARKIYNTPFAAGKIISIDSANFTVSGVIADNPPNSSFKFTVILPMQRYLTTGHYDEMNYWFYATVKTFVRLSPQASAQIAENKINKILEPQKTPQTKIALLPLQDMYFHTDFQRSAFLHGDSKRVIIFTWLAVILLLTASINYVNFSIAKTSDRFKELCVRKVTGATATQLFLQVMAEALVNTLVAVAIAFLITLFAIPLLGNLTGSIFSEFSVNTAYVSIILVVLASVVLLTGIYPAIILSSQKTMNLLRGQLSLNVKNSWLKQTLIVIQFSFAIFMIIATIVAQRQLKFIQQENSAYDKSQVFTAHLPSELDRMFRYSADTIKNRQTDIAKENFLRSLKQEIKNLPQVKALARANFSSVVNNNMITGNGVNWDGKPEDFNPAYIAFSAEKELAGILNLQLIQGRWFNENLETDKDNIILNETAVRKFGLPEPIIGKRMNNGIVIGIVKDFYHQNMREPIVPLVYRPNAGSSSIFIQTNPRSTKEALAATEAIFKKHFPNSAFDYSFADEEFALLYKADQNFLQLAFIFSGLSILISILGLVGLTMFMINRRRKEIGIRKVMGASVPGITVLISKEFFKLVIISIIIAIPAGWWVMNNWLQDYQYRITLSWPIFALASLIGMLAAVVTLGMQAVRAARANPVQSLKND